MSANGRLRPGVPILWRSLTDVQLGTDPRWAVVLADLSPGAALALRDVTPASSLSAVRRALHRQGVDRAESVAVLDHLRAAQLVVDVPARGRDHPDRTALCLLAADGDGDEVLAVRARRRVVVHGDGRVATALAGTLAAAGVGSVRSAPATAGAGVDVRHGPPDLVVLVEPGAADPLRHGALLADDVPHLSVVVREASVLVGPLVVPGTTACLRCVDLHRTERDERWPAIAPQLVGRPVETETTLAASAAALAAAQALAQLDGRPVPVAGASVELRLPDLSTRRTTWPPHPRCGCGGLGG